MKKQIIILAGATASGKTQLAILLSKKIPLTIINADSKQIYKHIPIVTAQPDKGELSQAEHKLYGIIEPSLNFSVAKWIELAKEQIHTSWKNGKTPLLVGGTGMYLKSITEGIAQIPDIKPETREETRKLLNKIGSNDLYQKLISLDSQIEGKFKPNDSQRICRAYEVYMQTKKSIVWWQNQPLKKSFEDVKFHNFFLNPSREILYDNSNRRFINMIEKGVVEEVKNLIKMNLSTSLPAMKSYGIPDIVSYLNGSLDLEEAILEAQKNTRNYIKRQTTWFRHQMNDKVELHDNSTKANLSVICKNIDKQNT